MNRCDVCGKFRSCESLHYVENLYTADLYGTINEDSYLECSICKDEEM